MIYGQTVFTKIPKKTIHLDLYVDESKNRTYTDFNGNTETNDISSSKKQKRSVISKIK